MATCDAFLSPSDPIILIYIQEIDRILELPQGAADTAPIPVTGPQSLITAWFGKYTSKCLLHAIGPIPGPPPP